MAGVVATPAPSVVSQATRARFDIPTSADEFMVPGAGQGLENIGKLAPGFAEAAKVTDDIAYNDALVQNNMAAKEMETAATKKVQDLMYNPDTGYLKTTGRAAKDGAPAVLGEIDKIFKAQIEAAPNSYQKKKLTDALDSHSTMFNGQVQGHAMQQTREWEKGVVTGALSNDYDRAASNAFDPAIVEKSARDAEANARQLAILQNTDQDQAAKAARSNIYSTTATLYLNKDPRMGLNYFDANKKHMDAKDIVRMDGQVTAARDQVSTDNLVLKYAPTNDKVKLYGDFVSDFGPLGAAAIVGHAMSESGVSPTNTAPKVGSGGTPSVGLMQWNNDRLTSLKRESAKNGVDWRTTEAQTAFIKYELNGPEKVWGDRLKAAKTPEEANDIMIGFLRPGGSEKGPKGVPSYNERLGNIKSVMRQADDVVGSRDKTADVAQRILADESQPMAIRQAAVAKVMQNGRLDEMKNTSMLKAAADNADYGTMQANQGIITASVLQAKLQRSAELALQAGDRSEYGRYTWLGQNSNLIANFANQPLDKQKEMIASMSAGSSKKMMESQISMDKEKRTQEILDADNKIDTVKKAIGTQTPVDQISGMAKDALDTYIRHNQTSKAVEVRDTFRSYSAALSLTGDSRISADNNLRALESSLSGHQLDPYNVKMLDYMKDISAKNSAAFEKDSMAATEQLGINQGWGSKVVVDFSHPENMPKQLATRMSMARNGEAYSGKQVSLFTNPEMDKLSTMWDTGSMDQKIKLATVFGTTLGSSDEGKDRFYQFSNQLAAKGAAGQGLAAAMLFYSKGTPEDAQTAARIIKGNELLVKGGESGKDSAIQDPIWRSTISGLVGNVMVGKEPRDQAMIYQAVKALYAEQAGVTGDKGQPTDDVKLGKAVTDAIGNIVDFNGQKTVMPRKDMDHYDFQLQLRKYWTPERMSLLRSDNGTPIKDHVMLYNAQYVSVRDGMYKVMIPEAGSGVPKEVRDPADRRRPLIIDLKQKIPLDNIDYDLGKLVPDAMKFKGAPPPAQPDPVYGR